MTRRLLAVSAFLALSMTLLAVAQEAPKKAETSGAEKEKAVEEQEILNRQFRDFEASLLRLAQRLEHSGKPEDRERAVNLKKAIALASDRNVDTNFERLISILKSSKALSMPEIEDAMEKNQMLAEDIRAILALLLTDNRDDEIRREKERLAALIKRIDEAIRAQKLVRTHTEGGHMEKDPLAKLQNKVGRDTADIARDMGRDSRSGKEGKEPKEGKNGAGKEGETKEQPKGDGKPEGDAKSKEQAKGGEKGEGQGKSKEQAKGGEKGEGQGKSKEQAKGGGKGGGKSKSQGQPGQEGQPGDPSKGDPSADKGQQPPDDSTPGRKQVQEANEYQKQAEKKIQEDKKDVASDKQDKAIQKLDSARKKLEEILRQLREEEIERVLAALQGRCERMLQMQLAVYEGTVRLDKVIHEHSDQKPERIDEQKSLQLSDRELEIVAEADKAIAILKAEGSAVAFPEVFFQVRDDMAHVARRLGKVDVGNVTQVIEQDIIATLKDMIDALKKQRQEMDAKKGQPSQGQPPNPKLVELLAEIKMIRAMQVRLNSRTVTYAQQYVEKEGEQTRDPDIQKELRNLSERQLKILLVTDNLNKGKNK